MRCYWRFVFALMGFFGLFIVYMLRVNLSVGIIAMVNSTYFKPKNYTAECPTLLQNNTDKKTTGEFMWDVNDQTMILSSFYWGYAITQIPSVILLIYFKPKWIYGLSTVATPIFTLIIPAIAQLGVYPMVALRFVTGLCEGPTYASLIALCGYWVLEAESSGVVTFICVGGLIGTITGQSLTGLIIDNMGWRWSFYIQATVGCVWFVIYCFVVYNRPVEHPFISDQEKNLLISSLPHNQPNFRHKRVPVPWKRVLTSSSFLGFLIMVSAYNFTWYTLINCLPMYIGSVLGFNISQNGGISSLPYVALFICNLSAGVLQDFIKSKKILSNTNLRKTFACSGMILSSIIMYCMIYTECNIPLAISLVCLSVALMGFAGPVTSVNVIDMAPAYAGQLIGVCNLFNSVCGIVAPYVKSYYTQTGETRKNWENVFITNAAILFFGALTFALFGSGKLQTWAILDPELENLVSCKKVESEGVINDYRS
uniref:Slc17a-9 n=1 Tax=Schmidtea mediterranea TaxID=79327 RepID=A0A0H3YFB4_SCHMD|nr:slc17a-9 [Schmidtea mediterranea]